ncbi:chorismate synthase [bacterium]|nr:chorismate synthase [bacterium]
MADLRFVTAGESHGPQLTGVIEGLPAGLPVSIEAINRQLARRQRGYGRGGRMKIEKDEVEIVGGVRWGETLGGPVALVVRNRDWENWKTRMSPDPAHKGEAESVDRPRPGHADLAGVLKYAREDVRDILERASARETTMRVAIGGLVRQMLELFGIRLVGYVVEMGAHKPQCDIGSLSFEEKAARSEASPVRCLCPEQEKDIVAEIDRITGSDTLGGIYQVEAHGLPIGLGSHVQWHTKLDARLAAAMLSIQAHKGVEFGLGFEAARRLGSQVHDEIIVEDGRITRASDHAGGLEGGMTNGQVLIVRAAMKPISTLARPLRSVNLKTRSEESAAYERSDVTAVPAAAVIGENVVAWEIARAMVEKFGGDSLSEMRRNYDGYMAEVAKRLDLRKISRCARNDKVDGPTSQP